MIHEWDSSQEPARKEEDFDMVIRRFKDEDAQPVSDMIIKALRISNSKDYSARELEEIAGHMQPEDIKKRAGWTHFYVVLEGDFIVGSGAIGPYWDSLEESCLFTIFVDPNWQGKGIGRKIIETLEQDAYFKRARRIEIPASITGVDFYRKMGYDFKEGGEQVDAEGLYRLEKFRTKQQY